MNQHVNSIANRLSLRTPQRNSLEILARVCEIIDLDKSADIAQQLETIKYSPRSKTSNATFHRCASQSPPASEKLG